MIVKILSLLLRKRRILYYTIASIFLLVIPLLTDVYVVYVLNLAGIMVIAAIGLNILTGYSGQFSIGHAGFFAIGAYTSALLTSKVGISFWFALPAAGVFCAMVGTIIGIPALRLRGHYLALVTIAFGEIVQLLLIYWKGLTNGFDGMVVPAPSAVFFTLTSDKEMYYLILSVTVLCTVSGINITKSRTGIALVALRDKEVAARCMGINVPKLKVIAFALSAFYTGIAGSLYGVLTKLIAPDDFGLFKSVHFLTMIVIGGLGEIMGSVIGALFLTILPELLRASKELQEVFYGGLLLLFIIFLPNGLYGIRRLLGRWKLRVAGK